MNTPENFVNRLKAWRVRLKLSQAEAAQKLGVGRPYFSQIENGREPGRGFIDAFLRLDSEHLTQPSEHSAAKGHANVTGLHVQRVGRKIPLISWAQAGEAVDFEDVVDWENLIETEMRDPKAIAVAIRGDSMEPRISAGDIVILLCSEKPRPGDIVVARLKLDGVICKLFHLTGTDGKVFRLSSYNPAYPPFDLTEDNFAWIYPVGEQKRIYPR